MWRDGDWESGVGNGGTGDEASTTTEGEVLEAPLNENLDAALELNDVHEMDEEPDEPGEEAGDVQTENIGDGTSAADDGHVALVEIVERRDAALPFQARFDSFCGVTAALNCDLRDAGKRLAVFVERKCEIADDEDIGKLRNGEIGKHLDAATAIGFGVSAFGHFATEVVGGDATSPEDGASGKPGVRAVVSVVDAFGIDVVDHGVFEDFDTEAGNEFLALAERSSG